jgi:hypothetical protein
VTTHCQYSPTGFTWGYSDSGPAQFALAILADYFECPQAARALHQHFKFAAIAGIHEKHWSMADSDITAVFHKLSRSHPWLERLAIVDEGPIVHVVDPCAEHEGKHGRLRAIIPQEDCDAND